MFHELAFLACTFFVTGAICLGGALFQGYDSFQETLDWRDAQVNSYAVAQYDRLTKLERDTGEVKGELSHRITGVDKGLSILEEKVKKVGDDFYRHLSLNAKKTRGHQ